MLALHVIITILHALLFDIFEEQLQLLDVILICGHAVNILQHNAIQIGLTLLR